MEVRHQDLSSEYIGATLPAQLLVSPLARLEGSPRKLWRGVSFRSVPAETLTVDSQRAGVRRIVARDSFLNRLEGPGTGGHSTEAHSLHREWV